MNPLVDKALAADQNAKNLKQEAIQSLLKDRQTITDQLKALGHVEGQKAPGKKEPKPADPEKVCPVCKAKGHDARRHKGDKPAPPKPPAPPPAK